MSYDKSFDNLSVNLPPPELSNLLTRSLKTVIPNFLANGGIQPTGMTTYTTAAAAQAATANYKQDQYLMPYALNWNFGVQHVFHNDYTLEVRYLGTKGVHLPAQSWLNYGPVATPSLNIPTFLTMPSAQTLAALPHTTNDLYNIDSVLPALARQLRWFADHFLPVPRQFHLSRLGHRTLPPLLQRLVLQNRLYLEP